MAVGASLWRAYSDPRGAMARAAAADRGEVPSLVELMAACAMGFVASLPEARRTAAGLDVGDAFAGVVSAHLFGYLFLLPLILYAVAAVAHLLARPFGARDGFAGARRAIFRAALVAGPLALLVAGMRVGAEAAGLPGLGPWIDGLGYALLAFWLWHLAASFAEAEGLGRARRMAG
ncbi:YIP1 family protein [Amaricoccus sp.]|uniref:YIP1 family protein n=1 Tax=Amaricoccus sp. TaxID=1872485 RepID=UPI001B76021C|nr:YIP1 family protein [Amaricoccus sp.]MBP7242512.1 YIP1 family protein [Amaricoccus sp.]